MEKNKKKVSGFQFLSESERKCRKGEKNNEQENRNSLETTMGTNLCATIS
jgi:hypothetical protein